MENAGVQSILINNLWMITDSLQIIVKGEFISSILMYSGSVIDGLKIATNVQIYPHILSTGGPLNLPATGQRVMFLSGKLHDNAGDHMVSHVGIYFDSC